MRKSIASSADVLWNMLEMFAIRFSEEEKSDINKLKMAFLFRMIIPGVSWYMEKLGKSYFTIREFCGYVDNICKMFISQMFSDIFDEYFGYEDSLDYSVTELRELLDNILVSRAGIIDKSNGKYYFDSEILKYFLSATFIYRYLIVKNIKRERATEIETTFLNNDTCRYIGELTGEMNNTPVCTQDGGITYPRETEIQKLLSLYRFKKDPLAKNAVSNLVLIMKVARNNNLAGADLSNLDLRRNTFSHLILSVGNNTKSVVAKFDGSIIDQWCFSTPGYCQDNAKVRITANQIIYTNSVGGICRYCLENKTTRYLWKGNDFIQDFDIITDGVIAVSEMHNGVFLIDSNGQIINRISVNIVKDITLFHRIIIYRNELCLFLTRSKKLYIANILNGDSKTIDANAIDIAISGETIIIATRAREIREYNLEQNQVLMKYHYDAIADSYISRVHFIDHLFIYASTKDGKIIVWNYGEDNARLIVDLYENITDFSIYNNVIYVITDEGSLFMGNDNGSFRLLLKNDNRWGSIDIFGNIIALVSIEGTLAIYDNDNSDYKVIHSKEKDYIIPYLNISGCSFRGVDTKNLPSSFIEDLKQCGAIFN